MKKIQTIPYFELKAGEYPKNKVKKRHWYVRYPEPGNIQIKLRGMDLSESIDFFEIKCKHDGIMTWKLGMTDQSKDMFHKIKYFFWKIKRLVRSTR